MLSTLSGTPNTNAGAYGLMGAAFVASGLAYMAAPAATLAGVFGGVAGSVPAAAGVLWMVVGAALSCVTAGACYALKVFGLGTPVAALCRRASSADHARFGRSTLCWLNGTRPWRGAHC